MQTVVTFDKLCEADQASFLVQMAIEAYVHMRPESASQPRMQVHHQLRLQPEIYETTRAQLMALLNTNRVIYDWYRQVCKVPPASTPEIVHFLSGSRSLPILISPLDRTYPSPRARGAAPILRWTFVGRQATPPQVLGSRGAHETEDGRVHHRFNGRVFDADAVPDPPQAGAMCPGIRARGALYNQD